MRQLDIPPEVQHLIVVEIGDEALPSGEKVPKIELRSVGTALRELPVQDLSCPDACDPCWVSGEALLTICLDGCDPLAPACESGEACYPDDRGFACKPDLSAEGATLGSPCTAANECPSGHACTPASAVPGCTDWACCVPYCSLTGPDPCSAILPGTTCIAYYDEGVIPGHCGAASAGTCRSP